MEVTARRCVYIRYTDRDICGHTHDLLLDVGIHYEYCLDVQGSGIAHAACLKYPEALLPGTHEYQNCRGCELNGIKVRS